MLWKVLIGFAAIIMIAGGIVWIGQGMEIFTKDREKVVTTVTDEVFGTTTEHIEWKPVFKYGLLPDDLSLGVLHRGYSFVLGLGTITIFISAMRLRVNSKKVRD